MKRILFLIMFILMNIQVNSQVNVCLGNDATVCLGTIVTIQDCNNVGGSVVGPGTTIGPYQVLNIPYSPDPFNAGTSVSLTDDAISSAQNIGFPFCFFGTTYNQFYIGSNGWISFSPGQSTTFTSATIPSTAANVPKNCIMGPWQDWHPGIGGTIKYQVLGTAPYRRLVVSWNAMPMFSCTTTYGTFQIAIFETTNVVETRIQDKPNCLTWAGGTATHGLHNSTGTIGVIIPGRNSTQWTTTNEGYRFTPGVMWENTLGQTFPYNGGILTINQVPPGTTGYWLTGGCGGGSGSAISDTTWITRVTPSLTASSTTDVCSSNTGSVTANPGLSSPPPYTFNWPTLGTNTQTVNNVGQGTYTVTMIDGNGCTANATTTVGNTPATFTSTSTNVNCYGESTGTGTANMTPNLGVITYLWNDPLNQTTSTAVNLPAGQYNCTITSSVGCTSVVSVVITESPQLTFNNINITNTTCLGNDGAFNYLVGGGTIPYTYSLNGNPSSNNESNLLGGDYIITVTDGFNCQIEDTITISTIDSIVPNLIVNETILCTPGIFTFSNTSSPSQSIQSTFIDFGDGNDTLIYNMMDFQHAYSSEGVWSVNMVVTNTDGCTYVQTFNNIVQTQNPPVADFNISPNPTTMFETVVSTQDQSIGNIVSWFWLTPDGLQSGDLTSPIITYPDGVVNNYVITLRVTDNLGCSDTTSKVLKVLSDVIVYIPNTFTPDGDEFNQYWEYSFDGIDEDNFNMYVYNRWGELVWESHNSKTFWSGIYDNKLVTPGIYSWKCDFGVYNTDERRSMVGSLNIIR